MNEVAENLTGWPEEEAIGKPLAEVFNIVNEESRAILDSPVVRVLETGETVGLANNTLLVARNGIERIIADSASPIRSRDGDTVGVVLVFRDVTERKRAEQVHAQLASIVESSDDAIIGKTLDGIITSWNQAAEKLYGYSAEQVTGKSVSILIPPDHREELHNILEKIRRGERVQPYDTVRVRKDGRQIEVSVTVSPIKSANGRIIGASTIARDITERKQAEEERERLLHEIEAEHRLLQTVFDNAPVGIALLRGPDFVFELANAAY